MSYHIPVLLDKCIDGLSLKEDGIYVDVTFGAGGHSKPILKRLSVKGHLFGFDKDSDARRNLVTASNFTFVHSDYRFIKRYLRYYNVSKVDGILADFGVSSHQLDSDDRGFAHKLEGKLDMRMNNNSQTNAAHILNTYPEGEIHRIMGMYGEVKNARKLAKAIVQRRKQNPFLFTQDFTDFLDQFSQRSRVKYFSQVFQALRIEVNDELGAIRDFLNDTIELLNPGGRLVVMSYHSLEDRIVKRFVKSGNVNGKIVTDDYGVPQVPFRIINKKLIVPDEEEIERNPRARSAKLRIAERLLNG